MSAKKMALMYAHEKFSDAIRFMVASDRDLKERIQGAFSSFHTLDHPHHLDQLPKNIATDIRTLMASAHRVKASGSEGTLIATLNSMQALELHDLALKILELYDNICIAYRKAK